MLCDKDIRKPLFDFLEGTYGEMHVPEEKQIRKSRTDTVMALPKLVHIRELNEMPECKEEGKQFVIDRTAEEIPGDTLSRQTSNILSERGCNEIERVMQEFEKARTVTTGKRRAGPIRKSGRP